MATFATAKQKKVQPSNGVRQSRADQLSTTLPTATENDQAAQAKALNQSPAVENQIQLQQSLNQSPQTVALQAKAASVQQQCRKNNDWIQGKFAAGAPTAATNARQASTGNATNTTGMPDSLKTGLEQLSGIDLSDIRVHYNSTKPAQLNAFAYAQGSQIHVGPGQERHLPHEGWHAVQQRQGRVKPTTQYQGVAINNDTSLEREADYMGGKALRGGATKSVGRGSSQAGSTLDSLVSAAPQFSTNTLGPNGSVAQKMEEDGPSWSDRVWQFIESVQSKRGADSIAALIDFASVVTAGISTAVKSTGGAVAAASLKLTTDLGTLVAKYGEYRKETNDEDEIQKRKQALITAAIVVVGDIAAVIAAYYGGPAGALIGISISAALGKLITSVWGDVKGYRRDEAYARLMYQ